MPSTLSRRIMMWVQLTVLVALLVQQCDAEATLVEETKRKYITANHILDYHDIVDAFGHVSVRNPEDKSTFIMAKGMASALVSNDNDLGYYRITDASAVRPQDYGRGRLERFIHSDNVSLWDIVPLYNSADVRDNLVTQQRFGASLAEAFGGNEALPQSVFVLMKQHGFTTCAATIEDAVYQAVYAKEAALAAMSQAVLRHACYGSGTGSTGRIEALGPKQVEGTRNFPTRFQQTPWELWTKQVEVNTLYENNIS
ncbi:class II aldolase and Adducin N-terminal domain-containing protein [Biscogniauxia sp. FL1348]|nr:class II aldolase and Adducin N-terminal domain-containing protein [Biscogniauxia sp. FL1348]